MIHLFTLQETQNKQDENQPSFEQKEDVKDSVGTSPEEKNYNVPEHMVQTW